MPCHAGHADGNICPAHALETASQTQTIRLCEFHQRDAGTASLVLFIGGKATRDKQVLEYQPVRVASETAAVLARGKGQAQFRRDGRGEKCRDKPGNTALSSSFNAAVDSKSNISLSSSSSESRGCRAFRVGVRDSVPTLRSTEERSRRGFRIRVNRCRAQRKNAHNRNAVFSQIPAHKELHDASTVDSVRRSAQNEAVGGQEEVDGTRHQPGLGLFLTFGVAFPEPCITRGLTQALPSARWESGRSGCVTDGQP